MTKPAKISKTEVKLAEQMAYDVEQAIQRQQREERSSRLRGWWLARVEQMVVICSGGRWTKAIDEAENKLDFPGVKLMTLAHEIERGRADLEVALENIIKHAQDGLDRLRHEDARRVLCSGQSDRMTDLSWVDNGVRNMHEAINKLGRHRASATAILEMEGDAREAAFQAANQG